MQRDFSGFGSRAGRGYSHSLVDEVEVTQHSSNKVHCITTFSRFREDGSRISTHRSRYLAVKKDDRWALQLATGMTYHDFRLDE